MKAKSTITETRAASWEEKIIAEKSSRRKAS